MPNQSRTHTLMASAMLLLFSNGVSAAEQCAMQGEQPLEFRFFTDNNSWKDNGWILECEYENHHKEIVWEVPIGSIQAQDHTQVIREAACIPDTATCYLDIFDGKGDGLQGNGGTNYFEGWFALMHGATTVGTYKELEDPAFNELTYCVGPKCDKKPQEVQADDEDCQEMVYLAMQLDNKPQDISYQLICGDEGDGIFDKKIIWDGKGFTKPGAYIEEETCLPKDVCCEFIVVDSGSNGLTDPVESGSDNGPNQPTGFIYLETNYAPVLQYDGSTGETFGVLTERFGCDQKADRAGIDRKKEIDIVATEAVNPPEAKEESTPVQDEKEEQQEQVDEATEDEEMEVEVGDNVEGVAEDILPATTSLLKNYFGNGKYGSTQEPSFEMSWVNTGSWTVPPTSENWVSDDDYQNYNDDGNLFGQFYPGLVNRPGFFSDDVYATSEPSTESSTWSPTWAPTGSDRDYWALYDDVVEEDDVAFWAKVDDELYPPFGQEEFDGLMKDYDAPGLPWDPNAASWMNGKPVDYAVKKPGLKKSHKIIVSLTMVVFALWGAGLAVYYFREQLTEHLSAFTGRNEADDSENSLEKEYGETGDNASDDGSLTNVSIV